VLPLVRGDGGVDGYFDGAYRLPVEAQLALHHRARDAAVAAPAITLLAGLALYPLILVWHRRALRLADDLLRVNLELLHVLGSAVALRDKLDRYFWGKKPTLVAREIGLKARKRALTIT
jgi:hypothetical protein